MNLKNLLPLDVKKDIKTIEFPEDQFMPEAQKKTQIVLHHSAGWDNARGMFAGWMADKIRVATCAGIGDDGKIYQIFGSKNWAYHVNILSKGNSGIYNSPSFKKYCTQANALDVEKRTIGVELCSWGGLKQDATGKFVSWAGIHVDDKRVIEYPVEYRGSKFFERYSDEQIEATFKLVKFWGERYDIPLDYRTYIWDVNADALSGAPGVYTHCSYRIDKQDIHPQPEMIQMLTALG